MRDEDEAPTDEDPAEPEESGAADADRSTPTGPGGPSRLTLVAVGLLVGLLIGAVLGWVRSQGDDEDDAGGTSTTTSAPETAEAAAALVDAWERSRTATFLSGSLLERTSTEGITVEIPIVVAQRPPDRVVSTGSSVEGVVEGESWVCDEQLDGLLQCSTAPSIEDSDAEVAAEVARLRSYFDGELPIYRVSQTGDCFDLRLTRAIQAPPYGQRARFCFDDVSGAPSLQRVERAEGTDEVTLVSVRTDVTAEDVARVAAGDVDEDLLGG